MTPSKKVNQLCWFFRKLYHTLATKSPCSNSSPMKAKTDKKVIVSWLIYIKESKSKANLQHTHNTLTLKKYSLSFKCHEAPKVFCCFIPFTATSFFFLRQARTLPPLPPPSPTSVTRTISYCGNHFKVVYAISHHSKLECAPQCTHRSSYVEPHIQLKRSRRVFWCQRLRRRLLKRCQA